MAAVGLLASYMIYYTLVYVLTIYCACDTDYDERTNHYWKDSPIVSNAKKIQRHTPMPLNAKNMTDPDTNCQQKLVEFATTVYQDLGVEGIIIVHGVEKPESNIRLSDRNFFSLNYVFKNAENCSEDYDILPAIFNDRYHRSGDLNVLILLGGSDGMDFKIMQCLIEATENVFLIKTKWIAVSSNIHILERLLDINQFDILPNLSVVSRGNNGCIPRIFTKVEHPNLTYFDEVSSGVLSIEQVFPNFQYKMNKRHLNVSTLSMFKAIELPIQLLQVISQYLNFTYTIIEPRDSTFGGLVNGSWTGLVGQLVNHEASFVYALLTENLERHKAVDFISPSVESAATGVLFRKEINEPSWLLFWKPLEDKVYLCILASYISISLLLMLFSCLFVETKKDVSLWDSLVDILVFTAGCLFFEGGNVRFQSTSKMLLWISWWFFCVVIGSVYTAMLTKVFIPKETKPFTGISQLMNRKDWHYGTINQSYQTDMMIKSSNQQVQKFWTNIQGMGQSDPMLLSPDVNIHMKRVLSGNYAFINSAGNKFLSFLNSCQMDFIRFEEFQDSFHSLAVPKGSVLKYDLDEAMRRLKYSGLFDHLTSKDDLSMRCNQFDYTVKPLVIDHVKGILVPVTVGLLLAMFVLLSETVYVRFIQNKVLRRK